MQLVIQRGGSEFETQKAYLGYKDEALNASKRRIEARKMAEAEKENIEEEVGVGEK